MDNKPFTAKYEKNRMDNQRQQLAEHIYQEAKKGDYSSANSLYEAVSQELYNISDKGIEIMIQQKEK